MKTNEAASEQEERQIGYWSGMAHAKIKQNGDDKRRDVEDSSSLQEGK